MNATVLATGSTLLLMAAAPVSARAAEVVSSGLSYEADPSCPDALTFAGMVSERAPTIELGVVTSQRADVAVALREADGSFRGTLRIRRADGNDYVREMHGATCNELGSALAFVAALALSGQEEAPPLELPRSNDMPAPVDEAPPPSPTPAGTRWTWAVTVGLGIRYGIAPTWANTEALDFEVGPASESFVAPLARVGVVHAEPVTRIDRFGTTTFTWTALRAAGCPIRFRWLDRLEVRPCAGVGWGVIGASGVPSTAQGTSKDEHPAWADVFGTLRLRARLVGPLHAVAEAELVVPLTPYDFAFDPGVPVYAVPAVAGAGFAGLSGQFP